MKKIGESFKGILFGFILILAGIILLWWNEGNNVRNLKTTAEMEKNVIEVSSDSVKSENEGKLIATHGKLINEKTMTDEVFGTSILTPKLVRIVEMYQWQESSTTENDKTTYKYEKVWSQSLIDSSEFHESGHDNPSYMTYSSQTYLSDSVQVGAFNLNSEQIESLSTNATYTNLSEETAKKLEYSIVSNYYTNAKNYDAPEVGNIRVSFVYNDSTDVSVLAVQTGNTFTDFVSKVGKRQSRLMDGIHSGKEMIQVIKNENKFLKWILRVAGTLLIVFGFSTILKPISVVGGFIPLLGNVVQGMVGLISFTLGLSLSLIIIAVAWIRFRPVLGIVLILIVGALIYFLKTKLPKKTTETPVEQNNN